MAQDTVAWMAWGDAAFERARREKKLVFLHIGFPSCHWCHVMERESFQDAQVAALLNAHFVPVSVDREERPDVDAVYMAACMAVHGSGGWPLNALLTPARQPFYVATYLPREALLALLQAAHARWERRHDRLVGTGAELSRAMRAQFEQRVSPQAPGTALCARAVDALEAAYDAEYGGFGPAPKFPMPPTLLFLLRQWRASGDARARRMAEGTLVGLCEGGIWDHVGGGFMRYATDRAWCAPHYEKLLCDSALLARVYCEAWEATGRVVFRRVAERTLSYLLEEMRGAEGAFCASQDADAQGEEGAYYLLSRREMLDLLGGEEGKAYCAYYGIGERSLPQRVGHGGGIGTPRIAACNERVRAFRRARMPLARDDKALTGWNAMAVTALARMHAATGEGPWLEAARQTAGFLRERLEGPDGRLYALWKDGEARGDGLLDDYAHTALAALSLYRATLEGPWLKWAVSLARRMLADFSAQDGGFYLTPHGGEALPVRPREVYDGALPSGNAAALEVLAWLASLDVGEGWRDAAQRQAAFLAAHAGEAPAQHTAALSAMLPLLYPVRLLDAHAGEEANAALLSALRGRYDPFFYVKAAPRAQKGEVWRLCMENACLPPFYDLPSLLRAVSEEVHI